MTRITLAVRAFSESMTRPVVTASRFFFAILLLACLPAVSYSIVDKSRIFHFIVASGCEGALVAYCCSWIVTKISDSRLRKVFIATCLVLSCAWAIVEVGSLATTGTLISDDTFALVTETDAGEASGFFAQYFGLNSLVMMVSVAGITLVCVLCAAFLFKLLCRSRVGMSLAAFGLIVIVSSGSFVV